MQQLFIESHQRMDMGKQFCTCSIFASTIVAKDWKFDWRQEVEEELIYLPWKLKLPFNMLSDLSRQHVVLKVLAASFILGQAV